MKFFITNILGIIFCFSAALAQQNIIIPQSGKPLILSLRNAILLALRNNPTVVSKELDRISQKYALLVARNDFEPQYSFGGDTYYTPSDTHVFFEQSNANISPEISLKTHYGTTFILTGSNSFDEEDGYKPTLSLQVIQPLLQGFGRAVVMANLKGAIDTEETNRLALKQTIIDTITTVISDYMQMVQEKNKLQVDKESLKEAKQTVSNDKKLIKAGRLARTEIIQSQAQVATQMSSIQSDLNSIHQQQLALLKTLGLDPGANVTIPAQKIDYAAITKVLTGREAIHALETCKLMALKTDTGYQTEGIALRGLRRSLVLAKDQQRWKLDVNASGSVGGDLTTVRDVDSQGLEETGRTNTFVGMSFSIPIHDLSKRQALIDARIGLEKAQIEYQQQKRDLEKTVEDTRHTVFSNKEQLRLSEEALKLQRQNLKFANRKYSVGRISTFELIKDQQDLTQAQEQVLTEQIDVINALADLDKTIGITLDNWDIKVRY